MNIVFDFGGVLIDWNQKYLYRKIFDDDEEIDFFIENICTPAWNDGLDRGRSFAEATEELVARHPEYTEAINAYHHRWTEMVGGLIDGTSETLIELHDRGYRLYGLTNWSHETLPKVIPDYPFFERLEGIVVSGEEKVAKPDAEIYEILLTRYGLVAEESIFIDDNAHNIQAAMTLGFKTHHFQSDGRLRDWLREIDIL